MEEVFVFDWKGGCPDLPLLLCNFFHDLDLFEVVFGVVAIAIEGPVMVLYSVAEDVGFESFPNPLFIALTHGLYYLVAVILDQLVELVPVEVDEGLDVEHILQEELGQFGLLLNFQGGLLSF